MLTINGIELEPQAGETLIELARRNGIHIPSLCYAKDAQHKSSCMLCVVRDNGTGQLLPSCTTLPREGMQLDSECDEVRLTRTLSLELLLSDHRADCEAPCRVACPAGLDVAAMNRLYDEGKTGEAIAHLRNSLAIPATLCFLCPAPCERICRRGDVDSAVPIREIKKLLVAQTDLQRIGQPAHNGLRVAVLGASAAGLAAAYHLRGMGYGVTLFDLAELKKIEAQHPDVAETLRFELAVIKATGVDLADVDAVDAAQLEGYDGVIAAAFDSPQPAWIAPSTKSKQPARLVLEGRNMANQLHQQLQGNKPAGGATKAFGSTYSRFSEAEKVVVRRQIFGRENNASGCLYCDCDKKTNCRLRDAATEYAIKNIRYVKDSAAQPMVRQKINETMWFEPAKCIRCGLCVYNSSNGFTFRGRGFVMQVVLPEENARNIAPWLAELCPTGAICEV